MLQSHVVLAHDSGEPFFRTARDGPTGWWIGQRCQTARSFIRPTGCVPGGAWRIARSLIRPTVLDQATQRGRAALSGNAGAATVARQSGHCHRAKHVANDANVAPPLPREHLCRRLPQACPRSRVIDGAGAMLRQDRIGPASQRGVGRGHRHDAVDVARRIGIIALVGMTIALNWRIADREIPMHRPRSSLATLTKMSLASKPSASKASRATCARSKASKILTTALTMFVPSACPIWFDHGAAK